MRCYHGYFVRVSGGKMRVDEDEDVGKGGREWKGGGQMRPGMRVGVEDNSEKRRRWCYSMVSCAIISRYLGRAIPSSVFM